MALQYTKYVDGQVPISSFSSDLGIHDLYFPAYILERLVGFPKRKSSWNIEIALNVY